MNDYSKERSIHDYIVTHVRYDTSLREHSAYAALKSGTTVCQGYSLLMYKMLKQVGIKSVIVESDSMNHVWNMVCIDNKWYHVDATWDDPVPDKQGRIIYDYYNLTDFQISFPIKGERHIWDRNKYPRAYTNYSQTFESKVITKKDTKVNVSIINNIAFNIKLNKNISMKKVEVFDGNKFLGSTTSIKDRTANMVYKGQLNDKFYRVNIIVQDGRSCSTSVRIQPSLKVEKIDNINKVVKVKSLVNGSAFVNNIMYSVKKGDILTVKKDETISVMPYIIST